MPRLNLKTCPFLGPNSAQQPPSQRTMPADVEMNALKYLPTRIALSEAELELANRYENQDLSGGYLASQIAFFRRGPSAEHHRQRREKFRQIRQEVDRLGLALPPAYVELVESDDYVARLRHNNIWLRMPDELVPLPSDPEHLLYLIFYEGQGCAYWHLLLSPGGGHVVTTTGYPFGLRNQFPGGEGPDPALFEVYQCAESFSQWIVNYFQMCVDEDRHYEELLRKYPGW